MHLEKHKTPPPRGAIGPRIGFLAKLTRRIFNEALVEEGLFSGQQDILFAVVETPGLTPSELAKKMGVTLATASKSVTRMEKSGFLIKAPDDKDARIIRLYPTQKAKEAPEHIRKKMDAVDDIIKADMSDEEIMLLSDLLERAIQNMIKGDEKDA